MINMSPGRKNDPFDSEVNRIWEELRKKAADAWKEEPGSRKTFGFSMEPDPSGKPRLNLFGGDRQAEMTPVTEVMDGPDSIAVTVELPGIGKEDIQLDVEESKVMIRVNTPSRRYNKDIPLANPVDPDSASATYRNGILDIHLKKIIKDDGEEKKDRGPSPPVKPEIVQKDEIIQGLQEEVMKLQGLLETETERMKRFQIDMEKIRQRAASEKEIYAQKRMDELAIGIMEVADTFQRALDSIKETRYNKKVLSGVRMIQKLLDRNLADQGYVPFGQVGEVFNPSVHECVESVPGKVDTDTVLEVTQRGYRDNDRIVRPAVVKVSVPEKGSS